MNEWGSFLIETILQLNNCRQRFYLDLLLSPRLGVAPALAIILPGSSIVTIRFLEVFIEILEIKI
jgi:hypothetical protein